VTQKIYFAFESSAFRSPSAVPMERGTEGERGRGERGERERGLEGGREGGKGREREGGREREEGRKGGGNGEE
jgi:hypothetical protein